MKKVPPLNRRDFLRYSLAGLLGSSPFLSLLGSTEFLNASESPPEDYKAIVCIFLEGGADVFNMIVPTETAPWRDYRACRKAIALQRSTLLPFEHLNANGMNPLKYGFRENMTGMLRLFDEKGLAIIANVGTLVQEVTAEEVRRGAPVPFELFAHNTQQNQWMMGDATGRLTNGWGGRTLDAFYPPGTPGAAYGNVNTADVASLLLSGGREEAIRFDDASISPNTMEGYGFGPESGGGRLGRVYSRLYRHNHQAPNLLLRAMADRQIHWMDRPYELAGLFDNVHEFDHFSTGVHEVGKPLGSQLKLIAQILSVKDNFPGTPKRQIFFAVHHDWDTHNSDNEHQAGYLSECLEDFRQAMQEIDLDDQVVTVTLSDFGRSLTSNEGGTDHGWGSHAFVTGGAVKGGDIYGKMPAVQPDSPDAWFDRVVPTLSVESYLATLLKWFGADEEMLDTLFPNLRSFSIRDIGFL